MTKSANHWHLFKIKNKCGTLTYQAIWFSWVLAHYLTSLADHSVVSRVFTNPFFLISCSLHFEAMVSWCDKQTEPVYSPTCLEVYWCLILSLPVPFFPPSHQSSPWPYSPTYDIASARAFYRWGSYFHWAPSPWFCLKAEQLDTSMLIACSLTWRDSKPGPGTEDQ